jgi:HB1, ASXL, restriction endonuclease HTH domain
MDFKAAARGILREVGHRLHYTDITEIALESGYLRNTGRTPQNTMRARPSVDVRDNPETTFIQTPPVSMASRAPLSPSEMLYIEGSSINTCQRPKIEEKRWLR